MCAITLILGVLFGKRRMQSLKNSWPAIWISTSYMEECFTFGTTIITFRLDDHTLMQTIPTSLIGTSRSIHLFWTQQMALLSCLQLWLT
jgi:hypothetical protein